MADLGKVAIRPKGKYIVGAAYEMLDLVEHEGSSFLSIKDTSIAPADDGVNWMLIAKKGIDDIATADLAGVVKPDGITITIDEDGTLHGASQVPEGVTYVKFEEPEVPPEGEEPPVNPALNDADTLGGNPPEHYAPVDKVEEVKVAVNEIIGNLEEISNDNILINPNFSINQRGLTSYSSTSYSDSKYTVDRWCIAGTSATLKVNSASVTFSGKGLLQQMIDRKSSYYIGKTFTLSAKVKNVTGSPVLAIACYASGTVTSLNITGEGIYTTTGTIGEQAIAFNVYIANSADGDSVEIEWIKLEEGTKRTAFMEPQNDLEILKCMRYYAKNQNISAQTSYIYDNVLTTCSIRFPVPMRSTPTIKWLVHQKTMGMHTYNLSFNRGASNGIDDYISFRNAGSICKENCVLSFNLTNVPVAQYIIDIYGSTFEIDAEMH